MPLRYRTTLLAVVLLFVLGAPTSAGTFTATWDYPFHFEDGVPEPTPFYDCYGWGSGGLFCGWLWDQGLETSLGPTGAGPMYGDGPGPFNDAIGAQLPLASEISHYGEFGFGDGLLQIVPECRPGLEPCFDTFTPLSMVAEGFFGPDHAGGVFFTSSRGGLVTAPNGLANFAGPEWTDIAWMYVGLYLPDECADPETQLECGGDEQSLTLQSLTFEAEPIPEPASVMLFGAGLLAFVRRYRR